jgi:hypothetical protein
VGNRQGFDASRRQVLQVAVLGIAAALAPRRVAAQALGAAAFRLGDAHAHLFNMSDLPVRGFIRHVGLPAGLERNGPVPALLDLIDKLQPLAVTAAQELSDLERGIDPVPVHSTRLFNEALRFIAEGKGRSSIGHPGFFRLVKLFGRPLELADSYGLLDAVLSRLKAAAERRDTNLEAVLGIKKPGDRDVIFGGDSKEMKSGFADRVLRLFRPGSPKCPEAPRGGGDGMSLAAIRAQLQWVHLMAQPRRCLLKRYLEVIQDGKVAPTTIVNLLVDYDRWLSDLPSPGSRHRDQIAFWTRLARDKAGTVDIRTFAGFDPLKHAEERRDGGGSAYLDDLLGFYHDRWNAGSRFGIHGFKLYPPMGFAPSGNVAWMFEGDSPTVQTIRARWAGRFPDRRIHEELNRALDEFFRACSDEGIPVLAHAFHSNEAGHCFGSRASPLGWEPVLRRNPRLKICLGHFADAKDFAAGLEMAEGADLPPHMWPLTGTSKLLDLNREREGRAYADISYMSELLQLRKGRGRERAVRFFLDLKTYCFRHDPQFRHILFGSDWLLLAREDRNQAYVSVIRQAMAEAGWEAEWIDNLFFANLQRFVGPSGR